MAVPTEFFGVTSTVWKMDDLWFLGTRPEQKQLDRSAAFCVLEHDEHGTQEPRKRTTEMERHFLFQIFGLFGWIDFDEVGSD